eukprot:4308441-Pleurochrysis_carterae.AAC.1
MKTKSETDAQDHIARRMKRESGIEVGAGSTASKRTDRSTNTWSCGTPQALHSLQVSGPLAQLRRKLSLSCGAGQCVKFSSTRHLLPFNCACAPRVCRCAARSIAKVATASRRCCAI